MNKGTTNDSKDEIECAVSALCGKWFHIEIELRTNDLEAFVRAMG